MAADPITTERRPGALAEVPSRGAARRERGGASPAPGVRGDERNFTHI